MLSDATYLARVLLLGAIFLLIGVLSRDRLGDVVERWNDLSLSIRLLLTIVFGWPVAGYVSPVLIDFWKVLVSNVAGLGGRYLIDDINTVLLLVLIAGFSVQTTVLVVKLNWMQDRLEP
jgi:hypothetical protein